MRGIGKAGTLSIYNQEGRTGRGKKGSEIGRENMLELIQLSAACRGSQYRDIVPVCGGSTERVVDTSCNAKGGERKGKRNGSENNDKGDGGERGTNLTAPSFPRRVTR